jgi:phosphatidylinositol alpha-1,6-mannosyltransferase
MSAVRATLVRWTSGIAVRELQSRFVPGGVLVVSEVFPPAIGGSGALLENVYRRMSGRHIRVIAGEGPAGQRYEGPLPVERVSFDAPDWGLGRPASLRRHLRVGRQIRRALAEAPAVVHCARALPEGLSARIGMTGRTVPYVCWLHGEELGYISTSRELRSLAGWVYRHAAAIVANSRNSRELLLRTYRMEPGSVHVVHPGVDAARFHPRVDGSGLRARFAGPGEVLFLSVGRLQRRKGHDMVLQALARLRPTMPHLRYVVAGDGPERRSLEEQATQLGLDGMVTFAGAVPDDELPMWYRAADVFVLPNRSDGVDFEGFGIVFLEAAACGLPVIAGNSGGATEAVADDVTGKLVDGTDADDVASAIRTLATDARLRERLGRDGAIRARREFGWDTAVEKVEALTRLVGADAGR